jgi:arylsulfatase
MALHVANAMRIDSAELLDNGEALVRATERAAELARPEYQELALATLPPSPSSGPFFRFDDNYLSGTVARSASAADGREDREFLLRWEFDADVRLPVESIGQSSIEQRDGLLVVNQAGSDQLRNEVPLSIPLSDIGDVVVRAKADRGNRFLLSWAVQGREELLSRNNVSLDLIGDGDFHTYIVDAQHAFLRSSENDAKISTLAIVPSNESGATVEIDYIRVTSKLWKYWQAQVGTNYETIGDEMRSVLFMVPTQRLGFSLDVPAEKPVLSFGTAVLTDRFPLEVTVSVVADGTTSLLLREASLSAQRWSDLEYDLSPWSGQSVEVTFEVSGSESNVLFLSSPLIRSTARQRFNVILIVEDALRADHLSAYGYHRETSPVKERFVEEENAVVFLNAHSQATQTRPSVPSLMTSLYPSATGVWDFSHMLSERYLTLAEILRAQGFATASFIQNPNAGPMAGLHQGFDRLVAFDPAQESTEAILGERVLDWLDERADENFFVYLHIKDPHGVYDPPAPFDQEVRAAVNPAGSSVSRSYLDPSWLESPTAEARGLLYDAEIRHNDAVIGAFLERLGERGLLENTLLIFTADHGEWMGEGGHWDHHPPGKMPVIHVPLVMAHPQLSDQTRRISETVQLIDVMPTILELASVDSERLLMHGDSLVGLVRGLEPERWRDRVTLSEEPGLMTRDAPCVCGSVFFRDWQLHGSAYGVSERFSALQQSVVPFFQTSVVRFRDDGLSPVARFIPDAHMRRLRHRLLSETLSANVELWRKITAGEADEQYRMDPETLERLRGLGYVN